MLAGKNEAPRTTPDHPAAPWHNPVESILATYDVQLEVGLAGADVGHRQARDGRNELPRVAPRSAVAIFVAQFRSIVMALLGAAVVVSLWSGDHLEAMAIGVLILVNVALGFGMELRARREMEALRNLAVVETRVRRDGKLALVPAEDLVVGDILVLTGGDVVTADARILTASLVQVDESTFTGESLPVEKQIGLLDPETPLHARTNMVHKGTTVTNGSLEAVVVATGARTELGHIARLTEAAVSERTPLEIRLSVLGRRLIVATLAIAALVIAAGVLRGQAASLMVKTGVALAVAAVPEGLPVVATLALARGMLIMARHNAIVRRLSAVETLGSASIICVDKTGTLTENRMTVAEIWSPEDAGARMTETMILCNNAELGKAGGDPMEVALLEAAVKEGANVAAVRQALPREQEWAFHPDTRMMASLHGGRVLVKGAPESVFAACRSWPGQDGAQQANERMASQGLRVIAVAEGSNATMPYDALQFHGLIGLMDPPRSDIAPAIAACRVAGIDVCMVTGDQQATAVHIANAVGIATTHVMQGHDIPSTPNDAQTRKLREVRVFSRVSPEQKLAIIAAHQSAGHVVAMTGDGVNDAPALRKADIGIAMGQRGTPAAREAADVVLRDDAFTTIVEAVRQGRAIFANIRRFALYLLSCNVGEVAVVALATLLGSSLPLLPLQILFLNFVTDVFPALALGFNKGDPHAMNRGPRPAEEEILTARHGWWILAYGGIFAMAVLGAFAIARGPMEMDATGALTVSFTTLALAQLWHVFNMRDPLSSIVDNDVVRNPFVWGAIGLSAAIILLGIHVPALAELLSLRPLVAAEWALVLAASVVPLIVGQISLMVQGRMARAKAPI